MRRILVTGGCGQLGRAVAERAKESSNCYIIATRTNLDITDLAAVKDYVLSNEVDTIINCAAYTDVEGAEEHIDSAYAINRDAVATLREASFRHNIKLIHISTDYVFGGDSERNRPYTEKDDTTPINIYGKSKAAGEDEVLQLSDGVVIRTSWLYSPWGKKFMLTIRRLAQERDEISVVNDQRGTPTSAIGLADMLVSIIDNGAIDSMAGIYHYTDGSECTWYDFAREIVSLSGYQCHITPCSSEERKTKARRPAYSVLDKSRIANVEGVKIVAWQERLRDIIEIIKRSL